MLNVVSNIAEINGTNEVKLKSVQIPKALPRLNSFVKVEVLENVKGFNKILINGSLFQSKLPVKVKIGDILFAQIISHNPVTIALDNFVVGKLGEEALVNLIFSKLGLKKTTIANKIVEFLVKSKKTISKDKLKNLTDLFTSSDLHLDDIQLAFIAAYFWDESNESFTRKKNIYKRLFDINFVDLNIAIFKTIVRLSSQNLDNYFYEELKNKLIFNHTAFEQKTSFGGLFGKVKNSIEFAEFIDKYKKEKHLPDSVLADLNLLKEYLIKYVLQKSLLNKYDLFYDFAITLNDEGLHLWNFEIVYTNNSLGEKVAKIETFVKTRNATEINSKVFLTGTKIQGEVRADNKSFELSRELGKINGILGKRFSVDSKIKFMVANSY